MCGRYALSVEREALLAYFGVDDLGFDYEVMYNIAPGSDIPAFIAHMGTLRSGKLRWGLVPSWARDEKIGYKLINARAETLAEKPSFRNSFRRKRCVIPADSFYEWKHTSDGTKQPMRIMIKDTPLFVMAGLYDTWVRPNGDKLHTCTIVTTQANPFMSDIHHRMPVILDREQMQTWLDTNIQDPEALAPLLQPYPADRMHAYAVQSMVNSPKNNTSHCFKPASN